MPTLIQLKRASFGYGRHVVLDKIDFQVPAKALIGILGPNGSGKSTLFRGLLGLIPPLDGTVERHTHAIGYVPQREMLDEVYPLTVSEVVHMGGYGRLSGWRGLPKQEREKAGDWLSRVGLGEHVDAPFASLSGGQRQRALIARALMARPELLVLDEPTSGIDRDAVRDISKLLRELHQDGLAILLVSHQLDLMQELVERAVWVDQGTIEEGPLAELLAKHMSWEQGPA